MPSPARTLALALSIGMLAACRDRGDGTPTAASASASAAGAPLGPPVAPPAPRKGMVWVPGGALVAGTPPDVLPRIADEEMPGEQVVLKGFYIDVFPYPDEDGAIPLTGVTRKEAAGLCGEQGKRLCSELEWERACKGPDNNTYEYGNRYQADRCATGAAPGLRPAGLNVGCRSAFGARDLHGGVWEWTSSPWGRGSSGDLATLRGGNAADGELVGRCANAMGRSPDTKSGTIGFRCCAGTPNDAEVVLRMVRGPKLEYRDGVDRALARQVLPLLPDDAKRDVARSGTLALERTWTWRPIGNERLFALGGCAGIGTKPACGVLVLRMIIDRPVVLAWASSGHWAPTLNADVDARDLWLFGGDDQGSFRRLVEYQWGRVSVGPKERRVPKPPKKKHRKH